METTLVPFETLPACAQKCGPLYDVNGACVPTAVPVADEATYQKCFCDDTRLSPFSAGAAGVCDAACTDNPADLSSIQGWYTSYCAEAGAGGQGNTAAPTTTSTSGTKSGAAAGNNQGNGGTWLDNHYQWVIFLVIMVVAIVGIWVGACVWRRRYLRKKDRQYALGTNLAHATESGRVLPNSSSAGSIHVPAAGMFDPAPLSSAGVYGEKTKGKKKWIGRS